MQCIARLRVGIAEVAGVVHVLALGHAGWDLDVVLDVVLLLLGVLVDVLVGVFVEAFC